MKKECSYCKIEIPYDADFGFCSDECEKKYYENNSILEYLKILEFKLGDKAYEYNKNAPKPKTPEYILGRLFADISNSMTETRVKMKIF